MKALESKDIKGNWPGVLIPFNADDSINYELLEEEIDFLIRSGVNGIYCNGTAGEFYNQREDECDKICTILAEKCTAEDIPFQIGVSHMSPIISLDRMLRLKHLKPGAFQVILPDWYPSKHDDSINFLQKMAEAAGDTGLVLYNPGHAKVQLSAEDIAGLVKAVPQIVGVKIGLTIYEQLHKLCPGISIFVPGHHLASCMSKGASGSYSNVACINPAAAQRWYEMMHINLDRALEMEERLQSFISKYIVPYITEQEYSCQAVDKLMASIGNWAEIGSRLRWPYKSIPEVEARHLRPIGMKILPEFFTEPESLT